MGILSIKEGRECRSHIAVQDRERSTTSPDADSSSQSSVLRRVLVADDEHLVAMGIADTLKSLGYQVCGPATDGQSALDVARSDHPDLALLDIRMPNMDGIVCAARLWNELEVPSVILSAYGSQQFVEEAQRVGVFGYLLKPVAADALRATLLIAWTKSCLQMTQTKRIGQLEQTLAVRKTVEMAKWRLIEARRMTEAEAHSLLQRTARNERRRLVDLAEEVLREPSHPILKQA